MNLEECFSQIDSCEFECEGGPLRLNVGYIQLKSNTAKLEQQLAALRELLSLIRDDLRLRSEDGVVDLSDFIWMRMDKALQETPHD